MTRFPHYQQLDAMSCGPTCLRIIARHHGRLLGQREAEDLTYKGKQGVSLLAICDGAEAIGLRSLPVQCTLESLIDGRRTPFLAHWNQNHFIVVYKITRTRIWVSDPAASGLLDYSYADFARYWLSSRDGEYQLGIAVFFELTPDFVTGTSSEEATAGAWHLLSRYLGKHHRLVGQLAIGTAVAAALMFVTPFLMQSLVDEGVGHDDRHFVLVFLIAQGFVLLGHTLVQLLRGWLLLYLSSRISVELVADFLQAMMRLPVGFFDRLTSGDILQRLDDHKRIERFLTSNALESLFSLIIVGVYAPIIASFSLSVFAVFAVGTGLYLAWVLRFVSFRRKIDHRRFNELSRSRANEMQLVSGIAEIKLAGAEKQKRWDWERIQVRLFRINVDGMKLEQIQHAGATLVNGLTMTLISGLTAYSVIDGSMTLGTMLALSAMLGQLNVPLTSFIALTHDAQDAQMSLRRMNDLRLTKPEEDPHRLYAEPRDGDIVFDRVSFRYGDPNAAPVLDGVSLTIPAGKTTAIIGGSGSGKTTLLKLLLKFYDPEAGEIRTGELDLANVSPTVWRQRCGAVMQDGFLFSDSIGRNIAVSAETIDRSQLAWAADLADARGFIESLPMGYDTKIGDDGVGLSGGQKQRVLIARALYRRPDLLLLDEATSALDANSESVVSRNFERLTAGMTKVIVAHRLSTVRNADQIVVLDRGRIVERGTHDELTRRRGSYFLLVKNQLELGT